MRTTGTLSGDVRVIGQESNRRIIGLIGAKGAGKTLTYNMLSEITPTHEIMLAAPLKEVCADILMVDVGIFAKLETKEAPLTGGPHTLTESDIYYILRKFDITNETAIHIAVAKHTGTVLYTPRQVAQYVGTDILRDIDHTIHIRAALPHVLSCVLNVVTDIRFADEYEAFRGAAPGFKLYYIQRTEAERDAAGDMHVSEQGLQKLRRFADVTIDNNGTQDELRNTLLCLPGLCISASS